jgi:outer membrane protein assembly complex protein YaeT
VKPVIEANGGGKIEIRTVGAELSGRKLKRYVPVFQEQAVDRDLLVMGARNLRDYFESKGYFEVEVDFETRQPAPDREEIIYVITPGERHKLVEVTVKGNRYFSTKDIRERMFLRPAGWLRLRHGRYSRGFVRRDEEAIKALYRANGFRDAAVATETIDDYRGKQGDVAAVVTIEEGPQYSVSGLTVNGVENVEFNRIAPMLAVVEGQPFSETNVALDREYILQQYHSAGYPDVSFDWSMEPGPGPHQFKVTYLIAEGRKRYVRDLLITGIRETSPRLLNPNVSIEAGQALSWTEMGRMQRNLYNLGVFDRVNMAIQNPEGETDHKYVLYHLEEGHRYAMAAGFGAEFARIGGSQDSLEDPAGAPGFSPRASFDISRLNMFGLGHSLNFKTRYSNLDRRVLLNYSAPRYRNVDGRNISVTGSYENARDVRTFTARKLEGSVQLSQRLSKPTMALFRYSYRASRIDPGTLKINPLLIPLAAQPARIGMISAIFIQDRRDDPVDAHRGWYNTLDLGLAARAFGSRTQFTRFLARSSYYHTVRGGWVLASNTQFGWLGPFRNADGVDPDQVIPLPERFFGGGSTSHRGFPDNQAGPRDLLTGFPLGGKALLFHNTELRFPFLGDNIDGVFFHDMGNVYSSVKKISFRVRQRNPEDFNYMVHAAGFGIRYRTPLGPFRVDLAYSLNPPQFWGFTGTYRELLFNMGRRELQQISRFQFFFSIGQAF